MPCATLHVLVHLIPPEMQLDKFPAIFTIKFSPPDAPEHYSLSDMIIWATLPYAIWQLSYHFLITVRKRNQIAAGRPTSFTSPTLRPAARSWRTASAVGNALSARATCGADCCCSGLNGTPKAWLRAARDEDHAAAGSAR